MSNQAQSLAQLQLPPTQKHLCISHSGKPLIQVTWGADAFSLKFRYCSIKMHSAISTITHLTTFPGSLTHMLSLILLNNGDKLTNIASLCPSPALFCSYSLSLSYTHTFTHWVLHLIHLGRGKQALPTTILVSMATANQVMSLNWPASRIPGDKKKKKA